MTDEAQRLTALLERLRERCAEMSESYRPEEVPRAIRAIELDWAVKQYLSLPLPLGAPADEKTGWPTPELMQDDDRKLSKTLAHPLEARLRAKPVSITAGGVKEDR